MFVCFIQTTNFAVAANQIRIHRIRFAESFKKQNRLLSGLFSLRILWVAKTLIVHFSPTSSPPPPIW